ncbi:sigma-70 family RNA polymerase sigma factor [Streptomyces shenzhenensis]|uniref:sigma-70 family RNA polymerase sigma factor n=1 Tax=Streptomyces shenzhenensis TaxID=943815 RepID=UPI0037F70E41
MTWTIMGSLGTVSTRERAMRTLYDEQASPLYTYVVRLLGGDRHRAEDVVQETLLRCWRTQDVGGSEPLRPWLFRVARNIVIDEYRLRMTRPREVGGTAWLDELRARPDGVDRMLSSMILKDAIRRLPPKHREVLYEIYYTGRSTREAALVLGVPPGTVKSRLHHAVRALRRAVSIRETVDEEVGGKPDWGYPSAA